MQRLLNLVYPHTCVICDAPVEAARGLCGPCWRDTPFIAGACCERCGAPLPGEPAADLSCDECLSLTRPWGRGRAAMVYRDKARKVVLALKHGDRLDLAPPAAKWMHRAASPLLCDGQLVVPIPSHWRRLISRRYNQAAVLSRALAGVSGQQHAPQALFRRRRTKPHEKMGVTERFANMDAAIVAHPRHGRALDGRPVLLVDDVMTSGATLAVAALACLDAGATRVDVAVLARAVKDA